MTNSWVDIKNADVILVMGGNPAEAHPCGFKWAIEAKVKKKAKLIVVDPRFTRTAAVADFYAPIRPGTDIAFLGGVIRYLLETDKIQHDYVKNFTSASLLVREDTGFDDGLFTGYDEAKRSYDKSTWNYQLDKDGYAKVDPTLQDPNCVFQRLKKHFSRYTPEMVERTTGTPKDKFLKVCEAIASTSTPDRTMTSLYALGWTQHSVGSQNIRSIAILQLLLGNMGMAGGGVNALRGHSNIQGLTDLGLLSHLLPGYLTLPTDGDPDLKTYLEKRTPKLLRPNQFNYWSNYPKFFVSLMKAWYGEAATKENDFGFDMLPKIDGHYDVLRVMELLFQGKVNGYVCQGFNPLSSFPDKGKVLAGLRKLKYLVTIDPLSTETAEFWQNHGEFNDVDPSQIQTEVFRLPSSCFAEENGSLVSSARWLQWHWKGAEPPAEAKGDLEIVGELFAAVKSLYAKEGGTYPDPDPEADLEPPHRRSPLRRGIRARVQRAGAGGRARSQEPRQLPGAKGRADPDLRGAPGRRLDRLRLLDLRGQLDPGRKPDGPPRLLRPERARHHALLGLVLAGQSPHPLQPRLLQRRGRALHPDPEARLVERDEVGRQRRTRLQGRLASVGRHEPLHHERRGRGAPLGAGHGRRAVPRALRAVRHSAREEPVRRRCSPIRPPGSSRTTGPSSASPPSSPSWPPPTGSPSTSTSGPRTPASRPSCSRRPSWSSPRGWRRRRGSATTTGWW